MTEPVEGLGGMQKVVLRSPKVSLSRYQSAMSAPHALIALCPASGEVPVELLVHYTSHSYHAPIFASLMMMSWDIGQHSGSVSVWCACHILDGRRQGAASVHAYSRASDAINGMHRRFMYSALGWHLREWQSALQVWSVQHPACHPAGAHLRQQAGSLQAAQGHQVSRTASSQL